MPPGTPDNRQRATIAIEKGSTIECWLNPKELTVTKSNNWNSQASAGQSMGAPQFGGGSPRSLSVEVLFDQSLGKGKSVKSVVAELFKSMEATIPDPQPARSGSQASGGGTAGGGNANKNTKRPPTMTFSWGSLMEPFTGNCKSLTIKYTLFAPSGEPMRAQATLSLDQAAPASAAGQKQNPTTRGTPGLGSHTVRDGDSLPSLAYNYYGDATSWRPIAEANGVDNPLRLRRGQSLFIPRID